MLRWFFQYSVICHSSKYIRLALTDFNKNRVICRNCMWLLLSQIKKKIHRRNAKKLTVSFAFCAHVDVTKIEKDLRFPLSTRRLLVLSSYAHMQSWNYSRVLPKIWSRRRITLSRQRTMPIKRRGVVLSEPRGAGGGAGGPTATFYWGVREPPQEKFEIGDLKSAF